MGVLDAADHPFLASSSILISRLSRLIQHHPVTEHTNTDIKIATPANTLIQRGTITHRHITFTKSKVILHGG